jgi:hypothetical protein
MLGFSPHISSLNIVGDFSRGEAVNLPRRCFFGRI